MRGLNYPNAELLGAYEEQAYEIAHIIEDFRFARDLLRRLGPGEHRRFSTAGWAWGSNTGYGGPPEEIYDAQLPCLLETLGLDLSGCFHFEYVEEAMREDGVLVDLLRPDGKPLEEEDYDPPQRWCEDILVAELRGAPAGLRRLERGLLAVKPDLVFYRARPGSPTDRRIKGQGRGRPDDRGAAMRPEAVFLLLPGELGEMQHTVQREFFEWLVRDWEVRHGKRKLEKRAQDGDRARAER